MVKPLSGLRVLDLTQNVCGPFCTQILYDLGAEVIKIEPPEGDVSRSRGQKHGEASASFMAFNRGKKCITLDLENAGHMAILRRLAEKTDLFAADLPEDALRRLKLDYEEMRSIRPDILYISINGYGSGTRFSDYSDLDPIIQAVSGFMSVTGQSGGEYTKAGIPIADLLTAQYAAVGALSAVIHRRKTGEGLHIRASKLDVMMASMPDTIAKYINTGGITRPRGNKHQLVALFQALHTKDGEVICKAADEREFRAFADALGLSELYADERFCNVKLRCSNVEALEKLVEAKTKTMTSQELTDILLKLRCQVGPINDMPQILESDYTEYHKLICRLQNEQEGEYRVIGCPIKFERFDTPHTSALSGCTLEDIAHKPQTPEPKKSVVLCAAQKGTTKEEGEERHDEQTT